MVARQRMSLLIDENVPNAVAEFFRCRGHDVQFVRDVLPAGTADAVVATIGDQHSLIIVTWDKDFTRLANRVPKGNVSRFRRMGRITFRCREPRGAHLADKWIDLIELIYEKTLQEADARMLIQVHESGIKMM